MALSGNFVRRSSDSRRWLVSHSVEFRKYFMRLKSTIISPRLVISGISALTTDEKIREAFAPFGNLIEAKVLRERLYGRSEGFAFVTYDTIEEAEKALNGMKYRRLDGYAVFVEPREVESSVQELTAPKSRCSVYLDLDDLDESEGVLDLTTVDKLREAFSPFGNIVSARICKDGPFGNIKGTAMVIYDSIEAAAKAQDALDDNRLGHHTVVPAKPKEFETSGREEMHSDTSYVANRTSEYTQITHCHTEAEAEKCKGEVKKQVIKKGDIISLKDLLFTRNRDYLVKNNNEHVTAEQLEGKVIVIYFLPLYVYYPQHSKYYTSLLKDVYYNLLPKNNFEVVLVANHYRHVGYKREMLGHFSHGGDPQRLFEMLFSSMPWTAIPYSDAISRKSVQRSFGSGVHKEHPPITMFVVDSTGMVLQCDDWDVFQDFGALGYPFSDERLEFMRAEDDAAAKQPSLKTLLASPERDYVISNKRDKVPIYTLEDKVVALYFFHADNANHYLTETLKLAKIDNNFEVVLLYITESSLYDCRSDCEESFWKEFKTMPWLALPFRDECCKKLQRVFKLSNSSEEDPNGLVIFGPRAEFIEPFGVNILLEYGISAYPFTCNKAVELEIEKIRQLKLDMLWDKNTVFKRNNGSQVRLCELSGKRVMVILEMIGGMQDVLCESSPNANFLTLLKGRYLEMKGTDDEFEVIRILADNLVFSTGEHLDLEDKCCLASLKRDLGDNNWILCLASEMMENVCSSYYWYNMSIDESYSFLPILAFDRDGRLVRKTIYPTFEDMKFPFYAGGLENEMLSQLTSLII